MRLEPETHAWLVGQAAEHAAGSLHKAIRDVLAWAVDAGQDDHDWLFTKPHAPLSSCTSIGANFVRANRRKLKPCGGGVVEVSFKLNPDTIRCIRTWERRYAMPPAALLDAICRAAVELDATCDVFASLEAGSCMAFPRRSADLYYDLGILPRASASSRECPCS